MANRRYANRGSDIVILWEVYVKDLNTTQTFARNLNRLSKAREMRSE